MRIIPTPHHPKDQDPRSVSPPTPHISRKKSLPSHSPLISNLAFHLSLRPAQCAHGQTGQGISIHYQSELLGLWAERDFAEAEIIRENANERDRNVCLVITSGVSRTPCLLPGPLEIACIYTRAGGKRTGEILFFRLWAKRWPGLAREILRDILRATTGVMSVCCEPGGLHGYACVRVYVLCTDGRGLRLAGFSFFSLNFSWDIYVFVV